MIARMRRRQRGHIARRLFLLFVLSAFVPLALIAALSLGEVRSLLLQQGEQRLAATAKAYGMMLYERLLVAGDLAHSAVAAGRNAPLSGEALARRTFRWIATVDAAGATRTIAGDPLRVPLTDDVRERVVTRKSAVLIVPVGKPVHVVLALASPANRGEVILAELEPDYLWGTAEEVPASTDFCVVEDGSGTRLNCPTPVDDAMLAPMLGPRSSSLATAAWKREGEPWRAVAWPQFMRASFATPDWIVVASQPERYQLARAIAFGRLYIPVVALALLLVTWLTARQASSIVKPLARLSERVRGMTQNDFKSRVELGAGGEDEFGDLASAFDTMSHTLGRQFASLSALSEIDRLILSTVDTAQVVRTVLDRLAVAVQADALGAVLLDQDNPSQARAYYRRPGPSEGVVAERQPAVIRDRMLLEDVPGGQWIALEGMAPAWLERLTAEGATRAYVQPVTWRGAVCGALMLGYRGTEVALEEDERRHVRELADRLAVAVSSAWRDEQLYVQAHFDGLTALPNRLLFKDRLGQEIARSQREGLRFAVLVVDLDHFKTVNDSFGHTTGDAVLREAARRIAQCVRTSDSVSRMGGDEFTVLLTNVQNAREAWPLAETIVASLSREFQVGGQRCFLSASVGIASYPEDGASAEELVKSADTAMNRAKTAGRAQVVYFEERMNADAVARLTLDRDLRVAIERRELELYYQPKLHLASGRIRGAEALTRWRHPVHGLISPERFIPLAEESGFIDQLGHWGLATACAQMRAWRARGLGVESVAVNVSPRQFRRRGLLEFIHECVREAGLPPQCIGIEITEGLLMERGEAVERLLDEIADMGHGIALDDFGAGFSSMAYLTRFPVREIKIDRVFIDGLERGPDSVAIVAAMVAMSHALGKTVCAEGVETAGQLSLLEKLGCDEVQGFLISPPVPAEAFERFVTAHASAAAPA
jgi:diguanylate cyclase (GGDEF)-like protein